MTIENWQEYGFDTRAVRAGQERTELGEHGEPIFTTSSFTFKSAAHAAARFSGEEIGNVYSRFTNPTVSIFQDRLAALEGGEACVATASGMSAILSVCLALLKSGDHLVSSRSVFGTITVLFNKFLPRYGIQTSFVSLSDLDAWRQAIKPNTRILFLETPSNPLTELGDIRALADLAHENNCLLVVDNCFCTPVLQQPLKLGADLVVHSATKFLDGQGRGVGGAVVGAKHEVDEEIFGFLRTAGPCMSPFNAWIFLKGLETLRIRLEAQCRSAQRLAEWLQQQPAVKRVYYPGLQSHPQHELAKAQQSDFGAIVSFELDGKDQAWRVIDQTRLLSITANLGDVKTTITHPASTTHGRMSNEEQQAAGIRGGLLRVSVGLESIDDIQADLARGLE
ncbi:MAG: O-succinylhomoserine sulfhydrylase [Gammaproteobacteria bacterium]|nr:O-succinylhomoserine sulfhydrylase [Gammaproteobacteria bacterium]